MPMLRRDWLWLTRLTILALVTVGLLVFVLLACGDDDGACPDSLASQSAQWSATDARAQCAELADALNSSGLNAAGDDDGGSGECIGHTSQSHSGGMCRATIVSSCDGGLSFAFDCVVKRDRTADCSVRIDAPELEDACRLRVLLR
jgi:hypothetical protein